MPSLTVRKPFAQSGPSRTRPPSPALWEQARNHRPRDLQTGRYSSCPKPAEPHSACPALQNGKNKAVDDRRDALSKELKEKDEKLKRLYSAIENGIIEIDDQLKARITDLKAEREIIQVSIDRIAHHASNRTQITPERIEAFSKLMNEKLQNGDVQAKKAYLRSVISVIEVDDKIVRIFGDKTQLAAALSEQNERTGKVRGFVRKWCARNDSNVRPSDS